MRAETGLTIDRLVIRPYGPTLLPATTLDVPRGSSLALLGDAGSGKSTVLETLADRRPPNAGAVLLDGLPLRGDRIGYAEQQHQLPDGMTAAEHLMVPLLASGIAPEGWSKIEMLLGRLGLPASAHHNLLEELSGGQQQRVAIARALVSAPPVICLDDPVSELDAASAELVWDELAAALHNGAVLIVATSRPEDAARLDQVLHLEGG